MAIFYFYGFAVNGQERPTSSSYSRDATDTSILHINITESDLNEIKKNENLATSEINTWLSATSETGNDAASNPQRGNPDCCQAPPSWRVVQARSV